MVLVSHVGAIRPDAWSLMNSSAVGEVERSDTPAIDAERLLGPVHTETRPWTDHADDPKPHLYITFCRPIFPEKMTSALK